MKRATLILACVLAFSGGCSSVGTLPVIPEYHPANAAASEGLRAPCFDVLVVEESVPPPLPVPEGRHHPPSSDMDMDHGDHQQPGMEEHQKPRPQVRERELHGVVVRPGMREGEAQVKPFEQEIKRGEAQMDKIVIPSEQRGMHTDETLYHEHEPSYSTRIVHPRRSKHLAPVEGRQAWACPRHPKVNAPTPGGRCPECGTILVPVKVGIHD